MRATRRFLQHALPAILLLTAPLGAHAASFSLHLHGSFVAGNGLPAGAVQVVLADAAGAVKAVVPGDSASGSFYASLGSSPAPVTVSPGDQVMVRVGGTPVGAVAVPGIVADTNAATDVTAGRILPVPGQALPATVELSVYLEHLVASPAPSLYESWIDATAPVGADGRFALAWNAGPSPVDLLRNDEIDVSVVLQDAALNAWRVGLPAKVTGMTIFAGLNAVEVKGPIGRTLRLRNFTPRRTLAATTLRVLDPGTGMAYFTRPTGQAVLPVPPTFVGLSGAGRHAVRVPPLTGAVDAAGNTVGGTTLPAAVVEGSLFHSEYDTPERVYGVSDAGGAFFLAFTEDVVPGDLVEVRIQLPDGTWVLRRLPVAP